MREVQKCFEKISMGRLRGLLEDIILE